jgi:hypothetical protein
MPTGYTTATLMEKGQTFQEFIMGCARAFGALIDMRDSPSDAPIPEKFEPSDYNAKRLIEARETLAKLKAMTDSEKESFGLAEKSADIQRLEQWLEKDRAQNKRLEEMTSQVQAWNPPTKGHQGLKDFMLQQISVSKNNVDYIQSSLSKALAKSAMAYYETAVLDAALSIDYHTKESAKEIKRANNQTTWARQLKLSIQNLPHTKQD